MAVKVEVLVRVTVLVTDISRARSFYGRLLGLEEIERPESFRTPGVWYRAGTVVVELERSGRAVAGNASRFCLWVEDIAEARRACIAAGVQVREGQSRIAGLTRFLVSDPDGNQVELQGSDGSTWAA